MAQRWDIYVPQVDAIGCRTTIDAVRQEFRDQLIYASLSRGINHVVVIDELPELKMKDEHV